ncbi:acetylserotonin O-methyltransferase [Streptomyces sp. RS10V-4]|uniref:acetylserotonin O-methyltransferase n=1 Tax=Streptomyces rhizoryzae TaxID=2932493 RepID=UPI002005B724|nr:acetylserotonin O-methyltransferase [Streptomyces rhizoryzae]MCK7625844.1 acetylserotonin O-methyltransferase [Streptomyces rhizoryzae]
MTQQSAPVTPGPRTGWMPAPVGELMPLVTGLGAGLVLCTACELGLPDAVDDDPTPVEKIADRVGAEPDLVARLLRALAAFDVFRPAGPGHFAHTRLSSILRTGAPEGGGVFLQTVRDEWMGGSWTGLTEAVRTGRPALPARHGKTMFEYFAEDAPREGETFNEAMTLMVGSMNDVLAEHIDVGGARRYVDVGGGQGTMLRAVLRRNPGLHGVLFDLAQALTEVHEDLRTGDLADRCEVVPGNGLEAVPEGADIYQMRTVLHMWDDDTCVRLLRNCARAAAPGARIIVIDQLPDPEHPEPMSTLMDLQMFLIAGGRERSEQEFAALFERAGLQFSRVVRTPVLLHLIEATVPAP